MKATLAFLLSLCLVLVDVSFGDDNGNTETEVTTKAGDNDGGKKCERRFPNLAKWYCTYVCKDFDKGIEKEDDGTPCPAGPFTVGECKNGRCVTQWSRISARSVEPTEESTEPTDESTEPTEETPVPPEETPDTVM